MIGPGGSPTQSLDRAMDLLEVVVGHSGSGITLGSLAAIAGLSKPTAHRLLTGLRSAGMIDYDAPSRLFFPAFKLFSMGQAASARFDVIPLATASLDRLAEETGDTVFLSARSGDFAVCVARRTGSFPIKTLALDVGDVRPLGLGANGLMLLSSLPDEDVERNLERHRLALKPFAQADAESLRRAVAATRQEGYAFSDGMVVPDMCAVAVGIRGPGSQIDATISLAAISSRLQQPRRDSLVQQLQQEVDTIERQMRDRADAHCV
ncbi:helix-turn-helix domain-containing protein [Xylophilus rhododendri]|uniref:Helix-turn-helix domain-containing protein n=1 Tax=Xylophilus rhododendri TaxID=2697032 RepID=A0A857J0M8_9BURK|nr:IclR family transcriptional regulator [Xylophilus rhododendri]QHI96661.1 helix-turn-helix domain-containing protein [Xylophilus rhododendri]